MKRTIRERGKIRLDLIPGPAQDEEARALEHGNAKPGRGEYNWRYARVSARDQVAGILRHCRRFLDGQDRDPHSLAHEMAHVRARAGIIIDAHTHGTLIDDRPVAKKKRKRNGARAKSGVKHGSSTNKSGRRR